MDTDKHDIVELLGQLAGDPGAAAEFCRFVRTERPAGELAPEELEALSGGALNLEAAFGALSSGSDLKGLLAGGSLSTTDLLKLQQMLQKWTMVTQFQSNAIKTLSDALKSTIANLP